MARGRRDGILIAGGGLAGSLAALAMARHRPDVPLLVVEERETFGGEGHRLFAETELEEKGAALAGAIAPARWPGFYLAFPGLARKIKGEWGDLDAASLHKAMTAALTPGQYRLGTKVVAVREDALVLDGGETIKAEGAIDARGATNLSALSLIYEARLERDYAFRAPHRVDRPVTIDATVPQGGGLRYFECVPLDETRLAIADVCISERSQSDDQAGARIDLYLKTRGWDRPRKLAERSAARPLPYDGDFAAFWRLGGARVAKIGLRGGFIHPVSGRSVGDAVRTALLLARQQSFAGEALHDAFEADAKQLWKKRELARSVAAAIAGAPADERLARLEALYRLDGAVIERLFGDRPGLLDRGRVQRALRGR
ncbi:MAG TPA: lycopene cyclase family protein [Allosphingosinicella sp.]|nr:lycopene cyclase family protein [Allosphingosinicella sp.]